MPGITEITTTSELDSLLSSLSAGQLAVLDFHAVWCGPCKAIAPVVARMAASYPDVVFAKIDVDVCKDLARRYSVTAMPTFKLLKKGDKGVEEADTLRGANPKALVALVAKHSGRDADHPKPGEEVKIDDIQQGLPPVVRIVLFALLGYFLIQYLK